MDWSFEVERWWFNDNEKLFRFFREKIGEIYNYEGTPLYKQKDDTEDSTQFCNNNIKSILANNQKLIDEAKKKGATIKTKLWHSLKQDESIEIIDKRNKIKASQSNEDQLPNQYGLMNQY